VVVKPLTFMNGSGAALAPFLDVPGFLAERDLLVISDDFSIPLGTFRLRASGSSGGHNGLASIERVLGSQNYARLRVGIGPLPPGKSGWTDFVLSPFRAAELDALSELLPDIADAIDCWANEGIEIAMSRFNKKPSTGADAVPDEQQQGP
jgi:PTH1 family peptidyl-tRNA hydrolase